MVMGKTKQIDCVKERTMTKFQKPEKAILMILGSQVSNEKLAT